MLFLILCLFGERARAQNNPALPPELANIAQAYRKIMPVENIFLHTDRSSYSVTDTIWFKAYLLSGLTHTFSPISGLIYIELISDKNEVVKRIAVPAMVGLSWSQVPLDQNLPDGFYTLRAYTNWMQNAGSDRMFTKRIYVSNLASNRLRVSMEPRLSGQKGKQTETINIGLKDYSGKPYSSGDLTWTFKAGETILDKSTIKTDINGGFTANLRIPDTTKVKGPLNLLIKGALPSQNAVIPVLADPGGFDVQFMPESGHLIAGIQSLVGFKAIAADGLGAEVEGAVTDSKGKKIVSFKSAYKGMGAFTIIPVAGETYTASVITKNGSARTFVLPKVSLSGVGLHINNTPGTDSISISVSVTNDLLENRPLLLSGFVNSLPYCEKSIIASRAKQTVSFAKSMFPSGIVHFTLFNTSGQPLSERMAFVDHDDRLAITIAPSKATYHPGDSIALAINMKNAGGVPVFNGSLSVAVTDDALVKQDSLEDNIVSSMLLASGIQGAIEAPAHYFSKSPSSASDLDLLMLTQGWVSYNWPEIFNGTATNKFLPEKGQILTGTVTTLLGNKPMQGGHVLVMVTGKKTFMMIDTLTDGNGRFILKRLPIADSLSFYVQARNEKNKKARLQLNLDAFTPAPDYKTIYREAPRYVNNTDSIDNRIAGNLLGAFQKKFSFGGTNLLDEVKISGKKVIRNSHNLNGPGGADQVIDKDQIEPFGEMSLLDYLMKNVNGMNILDNKHGQGYRIRDKPVQFVIDGWLASRYIFEEEGSSATKADLLNGSLNGIKMKDVLGVEVMTSAKYADTYMMMHSVDLMNPKTRDTAYIEITTRGGKGMSSSLAADAVNYKPVPLTWPKRFYRPRYTPLAPPVAAPNLRPTIHWEPQLLTSKTGDAATSFYATGKPGLYTVIVQGADLRGLVGYKKIKLSIVK